jgi:hypothetical protein
LSFTLGLLTSEVRPIDDDGVHVNELVGSGLKPTVKAFET